MTAAGLVVATILAAGLATSAPGPEGAAAPGQHVTWRPRATPAPPGTWPSIRRTAERWCGSGETAADRTPQGSLSSSTVRVFYAVPSDGGMQAAPSEAKFCSIDNPDCEACQ